MIFIDVSGKIQFANRQVSVLFRYPHNEIIGHGIEKLLPERFRARHIGHRESYANNIRVRPMGAGLELFGLRRDGTEFPVEISLSPVQDRDLLLVAAAIRDVSERKRIETELLLAREAAELARELANNANRTKSRFLATASHDLRQPLQAVELLNSSMRRLASNADLIEVVSEQKQAISAMSKLLNVLLDTYKIESGALIPQPTDLTVSSLFEEMGREFAGIAAEKGLRIEVEACNEVVFSDPSLVEQILRNLVSNAVKFTHTGEVRLRCSHDATSVRIEVIDTGIGIPACELPRIYDEFYQGGPPAYGSRDGSGLGLSIVRRLVDLLTLKLDVRSEVGRGSTFTLFLPAGSRQMPVPHLDLASVRLPVAGRRPSRDAHVLLVEDNASVRGALRRLLRLEGYDATAVASLSQALRHVQNGNGVDLLICDYHLENGQNASEVLATLREMLGVALRTIVITGDTSSAIKQLPSDPHVRVMSKPIESEELMRVIRSLATT